MKQNQTAAVYDRWLFTLGGGEQVAFAYAESLRDLGFKTSLITHQEIDIIKAQSKMSVNLKGIELIYLPMMSSTQLSQYTENFDVFINTSYLDYFPNRSKTGLLSIFFPSQIFLTPYEYLKRAIVLPSLSNFFIYPSRFQGFKYDEYKNSLIYKWLGDTSTIIFNKDITSFTITLFFPDISVSLIDGLTFSLDDKPIIPNTKRLKDTSNQVEYSFLLKKLANKRFSIHLPPTAHPQGVALISLTIPSLRYILYNTFKRFFPSWEMRLHGGPGVTKLSDLTSYSSILTISQFSQKWIKRYWGLESQILYPPVNTSNFFSSSFKKNWIIHVGRFFVTGHCKKQLDLVKVFRRLVDEKGVKDWELHFVGSVHGGEKHREYFNQVKYYAKGYPVVFHTDAPFSQLQNILSQGKIYWHATGLDENEDRNPILFEHFGITTVEAMASGCVPVVIAAGGQKEIVTADAGFLWKDRKELITQTSLLINDPNQLKSMQTGALKRAAYFDRSEFVSRFKSILKLQ